MKKLIFLDVDGTLVDYENNLPASAIEAVQTARKNGHKVFICTGRSKAEILPAIWKMGIDGMIGGNGAYVEYEGQVIFRQSLSFEECQAIRTWLEARGLAYYIEANAGSFVSPTFLKDAEPTMKRYLEMNGKTVTPETSLSMADYKDGVIEGGNLERSDANKISYLLGDYQNFLDAQKAFPHLKTGTWGGRGEEALFGDIGVADIDKAHAINLVMAHLGIDREDSIAFGDAKIDIPMFEVCGLGVAMGNSGAELLKIADMVTTDVEDDGIYNAFKQLELI